MSHSSTHNDNDNGNGEPRKRLIRKAIRYARVDAHYRSQVRTVLRGLDRIADPYLPPDDPAEPPLIFREELRRPTTAKRRAIHVVVDGYDLAVILNPQGKVDPERETWLWNYIRGAIQDGPK